MPNMSGRCLCGQITYETTAEPALSGICHCRNCQRYTGSAFETLIGFPSDAVRVKGEPKTYTDTGD